MINTNRTIDGRYTHDWNIVAQCHEPYREFHYCDCCNKYEEVTGKGQLYTQTEFENLVADLRTSNPVYQVDSNVLLVFEV